MLFRQAFFFHDGVAPQVQAATEIVEQLIEFFRLLAQRLAHGDIQEVVGSSILLVYSSLRSGGNPTVGTADIKSGRSKDKTSEANSQLQVPSSSSLVGKNGSALARLSWIDFGHVLWNDAPKQPTEIAVDGGTGMLHGVQTLIRLLTAVCADMQVSTAPSRNPFALDEERVSTT